MFNNKLVKKQYEEITYLRKLVDKLNKQVIALSNNATIYNQNVEAEKELEPIKLVDTETGKIESMTAETDEEKMQREAALDELKGIFVI